MGRRYLRLVVTVAAAAGALLSGPMVSGGSASLPSTSLLAAVLRGANSSGAKCDGVTDDTPAIQAAVDAAGVRAGGVVTLPAGRCALFGNIHLNRRYGVTVEGSGASSTFLVQHSDTNIFEISTPGNTVEAMNLDTATYNPGTIPIPGDPVPGVLYSSASGTVVRNITAETGTGFGMRLTGPNPCSAFATRGVVVSGINMVNHGTAGFAAVDIDCQDGARVSNITIHGGILAFFQDANTVLTGEVYFGVTRCQPAWFVTGPAHDIRIDSVVTHAGWGRIHGITSAITVSRQSRGPGSDC